MEILAGRHRKASRQDVRSARLLDVYGDKNESSISSIALSEINLTHNPNFWVMGFYKIYTIHNEK